MGRFRPRTSGGRGFGSSNDTGRSGRGYDRGDFGRPKRTSEFELTSVICAKCGRNCEVPFKPTSNKPVYCRECFKKTGPDSGSSDFAPRERFNREPKPRQQSGELDEINRKLDKIMRALKIE